MENLALLEQQMAGAIAEQKTLRERAEAEQKRFGTILAETKTKMDAMQSQLDAIDSKTAERHLSSIPERSLVDVLNEDEGLKRFMRDRTGSYVIQLDAKQAQRLLERKTLIDSTAVGSQTTGVLRIDRNRALQSLARRRPIGAVGFYRSHFRFHCGDRV